MPSITIQASEVAEASPSATTISSEVVTIEPSPTVSPIPIPANTPWSFSPPQVTILERCLEIDATDERTFFECGIEVYDSSSTDPIFLLVEEGVSYESPRLSPDGQWLAYVKNERPVGQRIHVISTDWERDEPVSEWFESHRIMPVLSWSPDSRWIAFRSARRSGTRLLGPTFVLNIESKAQHEVGENVTTLAWSLRQPAQIAFSIQDENLGPDSIFVAAASDPENAEQLVDPIGHFFVHSIAWHPDGSKLALCIGEDTPSIWSFDFSSKEWRQIEELNSICGLSWSPDGYWLAVIAIDELLFYETKTWRSSRYAGTQSEIKVATSFVSGDLWLKDAFIYEYYMRFKNLSTRYELSVIRPISGEHLLLWTAAHNWEDGTPFSLMASVDWHFDVAP
jgi:WD40 repeat protein